MFLEKRMTNRKRQVMTYGGPGGVAGEKTELRLEKWGCSQ